MRKKTGPEALHTDSDVTGTNLPSCVAGRAAQAQRCPVGEAGGPEPRDRGPDRARAPPWAAVLNYLVERPPKF